MGIQASTAKFNLTIINRFAGTDLDVVSGGIVLKTVNRLRTETFQVNGCAPIQIKNRQTKTFIDQWIMPYSDYTVTYGTTPVSLTVTNLTVKPEVKVFANGVCIGQVKRKKSKMFTVNTGDTITITDSKGNALQTFTMGGWSTTITL